MNRNHRNNLKDAPPLVEIFRGHYGDGVPIIERVHRGLIAAVSGDGEVVSALGDIETPMHMRSTAKPFQVLPLLENGFFNEYDEASILRLSDLALMMGSHAGQDIHTDRVLELLKAIGLNETLLKCGVHAPQDRDSRREMLKSDLKPSVLHNACSGKHVAMLTLSIKNGYPTHNYESSSHPTQRLIRNIIATITDLDDGDLAMGIDGCSLPTFAIPLRNIALAYARLASWQNQLPKSKPQWLASALKKIWQAGTKFPEYLAGHQRFDTRLIDLAKGQIFSKTGADGIHALSILPCEKFPHGLGIAIKISDGDVEETIRPLIIKHILSFFGKWPQDVLIEQFMPAFWNYRNLTTGGAILHL